MRVEQRFVRRRRTMKKHVCDVHSVVNSVRRQRQARERRERREEIERRHQRVGNLAWLDVSLP